MTTTGRARVGVHGWCWLPDATDSWAFWHGDDLGSLVLATWLALYIPLVVFGYKVTVFALALTQSCCGARLCTLCLQASMLWPLRADIPGVPTPVLSLAAHRLPRGCRRACTQRWCRCQPRWQRRNANTSRERWRRCGVCSGWRCVRAQVAAAMASRTAGVDGTCWFVTVHQRQSPGASLCHP